ncbi:uncharacterized protein LOC134669904 [Cydia fagiglandana]|uniref:uncharacterized protein LOC134669904 n=1 Tax=Cydia fagiglandana TaxID=1458189 RepID=UPI002FEE3969
MATRHQAIPRSGYQEDDDKDDEEDDDEADSVEWMNIIFLPFHPVFRFMVLVSVLVRINMAYAPTSSHSDDEIEEYYDLLNKACDEHRGTWTMVLGDFNAKVGVRAELDNTDIVGPHGLDNIPPITGCEVNAALKGMKYQKSPGDDGVTTEALHTGKITLLPAIQHYPLQLCLEEIFKKMAISWEGLGIVIGNKRLTNLRFADDIVLFSHTASQLQLMLQDLSTASLEVGLTMNRAKTKLMSNRAKHRDTVDGQDIQYVDEYIYLGQIASFENRQTIEVNRRIDNAWKSFWSMKALLKGDLPLCLKRKLIDMCILPILTYGAQTWSLTEALKSKLKVCQRAMERSILGVRRTDRIRNTELRSRTRVVDRAIECLYPIQCSDAMDTNVYLLIIKYLYQYYCDAIYGLDTLLHIAHRSVPFCHLCTRSAPASFAWVNKLMRVADISKRREHPPKPKLYIMLDIISLLPLHRLLTSQLCPPIRIWPNVINLIDFVIVYRISEYFSLSSTHSFWNLVIGYSLLLVVFTNVISCVFILLTYREPYGLGIIDLHDWRKKLLYEMNKTNTEYARYMSAMLLVLSYSLRDLSSDTKPNNITTYYCVTLFMLITFSIYTFIAYPKSFAEAQFKLRRSFEFFPRVQKIVAETKRKSHHPGAYVDVSNFYNLAWKKRGGITTTPELILEFPRHLRLDIKKDLTWPIFHHSPTLRRVSLPFIHWLCDLTHLEFKLPKEVFFASPHSRSHMFYLKSGIVQLISAEDGTTSLLSVSGGTLFGDINFFIPPPATKTVIVRCLTHCEIYFFTRNDILKALSKFPEDRRKIMERIKSKIQHARTLHTCKQHVRGLDRAEDEGVAWIKKRWWELHGAITKWKNATKKSETIFVIPPEEAVYHCSKYIGQLVLCPDAQLQRQSMFANCQFPWILVPDSNFIRIWNVIVRVTVALVLILYPPHLPLSNKPEYFRHFQGWTNIVYIADVCLCLLTAIEEQGYLLSNFASVMFKRCKSLTFILNVLASIWLEDFVVIIGKPELYSICQFNRLIKVYLVFFVDDTIKDVNRDPSLSVYPPMFLYLSYLYISGYFVLSLTKIEPKLRITYFFSTSLCGKKPVCDPSPFQMFAACLTWTFRDLYVKSWPFTLEELGIRVLTDYLSLIIATYCAGRLIAVNYLRNITTSNYLFFAIHLKQKFQRQNIHPELWNRLEKYVECHWRHNRNLDISDTSLLRHEPYDIYWKAHGEIAAKIIMMCKAFVGANPSLIKELAHIARFTILPKNSTILLTGATVKDVCWLVNVNILLFMFTKYWMAVRAFLVAANIIGAALQVLERVDTFKYLGHIVTADLKDDKDIERERRALSVRANMIAHKFARCTREVKVTLFRAYCTSLYSCSLWLSYTKRAYEALRVQYNNAFRVMMGLPRFCSASGMFAEARVDCFYATIRKRAASLVRRTRASPNIIMKMIGDRLDSPYLLRCSRLHSPYYDERGLLIYSKWKCLCHYSTRGLFLDIIALVPWYMLPAVLPVIIAQDTALLIYAVSKYARLHLFMGYFNYLADTPFANVVALLLIKWQCFPILLMFSISHYLIVECVTHDWDGNFALINITKRPGCWLPKFIEFDEEPSPEQMDLLIGQSYSVAQCAFLRISYGLFNVKETDMLLGVVLYSLTVVYWCVLCYSLAILMLSRRSSTLFQHAFCSLHKFLNAERLDANLIKRSLSHFSYWWIRTNGVNIYEIFIHKRVSSMFRQDIIHFFHKQTFAGVDTLLKGGEQMMKRLSCVYFQLHLLPRCPVMREMDLNPWVFIVHRGAVVITHEGKTLATLKKGSIFGQLEGTEHRPVRVSAHTATYTDILRIPVTAFQENIDDKTRFAIHRHPTAAMDYMQVKDPPKENPYFSIKYLLRGGKTIQLPWMREPVKAHLTRKYACWLAMVWFVGPYLSSAIVLILNTLPLETIHILIVVLILLDILHLAHFVSEFYTMELVIINDECVYRQVKLGRFKKVQTYIDIISLVLPMMTLFTDNWGYQLARLLRLRFIYNFYKHFCQDFKSQNYSNLVDFAIISLTVEAMVCGWVVIACRPSVLDNSYYIPKPVETLDQYKRYYNEWIDPDIREEGCKTVVFIKKSKFSGNHSFLVPMRWQDDYAIALGFIMSLITRTNSGNYASISLQEMYYECFVCYVCHLVCIWVGSSAFRALYLRYRELLNFDYNAANLFSYLKHSGLNLSLLERVKGYTSLLWQRQRGNWMPELVVEAPLCLREDLYMALYAYHLQDIPLFRSQPAYFTRQLATRLHRVVIRSGRVLLQEGDVFACIYFIHEGEVEKWSTDAASGERKLVSVLTTNGFFGLVPGLFPDTPVQFTFVTRTIVDMVFLRNRDWRDLLEGYPDIKRDLYTAAKHLKKAPENHK